MGDLRYNNVTILWFFIICLLIASCGRKPVKLSQAERKALESAISSKRNIDTLIVLQKRMEKEGNILGSVIAYKEMGKLMRNDSQFDDALRWHSEGLKQAEAIGDTLETVQALNNIGTDYRRMGVLDVAQDYHYRAYAICMESTDTSFTARKNKVVSLNGLGNIYLTLRNYARADSAFRMALAGERQLKSDVGQAINYANLGSIYRSRGLSDSAWVYFRKSMEFNQRAKNTLGISLCHTYFGAMYEQEHRYDKAMEEYEAAYKLMEASDDEWHALNMLIALAGVNLAINQDNKALQYLDRAKQIADEIKSNEHLEEIYTLYYNYYKRKGDCKMALAQHEKATAMRDSVIDIEKMNRIQNAGLTIERTNQARLMNEAHLVLESERSARFFSNIVFSVVVVILIGALITFFYLLAELNYKRFMFKKLCILLIFSKLKVTKLLIDKYRMHNLYAIFAKLLNICKQIAGNLVNESGNVPRRGVVPKFSDLEVVALNMASEAVGIDSESLLFAKLQEYRVEIPNLISRRQYNDRRKITSSLCNAIRERMVSEMDGGEEYFCIDSKPIEVCRIARSKRCSMGKKDFRKAPGVGYCASQSMYYYGYKLHAVCGLSGVIHSFDLTKASVHDIHYLKDMKVDYSNCTVIGDRGYISAQVQLDLFETANIRLEVPYRCNQKEWKSTFPAFAKARKRIETIFSQLCDQFMIIRNYAKDTDGLFARIIGKISALTILQYINYKNEKPIGRVKYALF